MAKAFFTNGAGIKNIDFSSYPDSAWTFYSNPPTSGDGQLLYQSVAFVFRCAQLLAGAVQSMPWAIVDEKTGEDYDTSDDYKNRVGFMPDPSKLFAQIELALFVWGQGYLFRERNTRVTKNLRYIVPTTVQPQIDAVKGLTGFKRSVGAATLNLTADDLVYFWEFDPWVELGPPMASRFRACMAAAGLLDALVKHEAEFVRRGGVLPTMLLVKGMPSQAERERLESYWDRFIKGAFKVAGKIFNAESMDVKAVGEGLEALKDANFTEVQRQDIATAAGVPLSMLMANSSNYATAQAETRWFWATTIIPECTFIASVMNDQVFNPLGLRLEWRYEQTDAFQEEERERALSYAAYIQSGMSPSVAAQVVGIELPPGMEYTELDEQAEEAAEETAEEQQPEPQAETPDLVAAEMAEERAEARAEIMSLDAVRDLEIWRRKALKKAQAGELPNFAFTTSAIPPQVVTTITAGLQSARTAEQVKAVFDGVTVGPSAKPTRDDAATILEAIRLGVTALKARDSYTPPQAVQAAARRGLELREKHGRGGLSTQEAGAQGIGSGVARATTLANGDGVSVETLRRMRAFFSRHEQNKEGGEDDAGFIAWQLWGGDAGREWVERVLSEIDGEEKALKFNQDQPRDENGRFASTDQPSGQYTEYIGLDGKPQRIYQSDVEKSKAQAKQAISAIMKEAPELPPPDDKISKNIDDLYGLGQELRASGITRLNSPQVVYSEYGEKIMDMSESELNVVEMGLSGSGKPEYVSGWRYGEIPKGGISRNYAEGRSEGGLSVMATSNGKMTSDMMSALFISENRPVVYVSGYINTSKTGSDGEPLLLFPKKIGGGK